MKQILTLTLVCLLITAVQAEAKSQSEEINMSHLMIEVAGASAGAAVGLTWGIMLPIYQASHGGGFASVEGFFGTFLLETYLGGVIGSSLGLGLVAMILQDSGNPWLAGVGAGVGLFGGVVVGTSIAMPLGYLLTTTERDASGVALASMAGVTVLGTGLGAVLMYHHEKLNPV